MKCCPSPRELLGKVVWLLEMKEGAMKNEQGAETFKCSRPYLHEVTTTVLCLVLGKGQVQPLRSKV